MEPYTHSVYLDNDLCCGCTNCLKQCPTGAIRVRDGKAHINGKFCIDCGKCIKVCTHHAKLSTFDSLNIINDYAYTVALPAPTLFGQFNNLEDINIVLTALILMGFDDVYEVGSAAELVSEETRRYVKAHPEQWPLISTACPTVVRLIQVLFPNLIEHLLPIKPPIELAAEIARKKAVEKTGLPPDKIGIIFISPCPSKVSYVRNPLGVEHSQVDGVVAIRDVYKQILPYMKQAEQAPMDLSDTGKIGIGWSISGGEAGGLLSDSYLAADGITNVQKVLEDLEDQKFETLEFVELNSCTGGCVGGVLNVENPFVAKTKIKRLRKYMTVAGNHLKDVPVENLYWTHEVEYHPVFRLGNNMLESFSMLNKVERLSSKFPGLDCGACGSPSCKALAEDIVRGEAEETDCLYIMKQQLNQMYHDMEADIKSKNRDRRIDDDSTTTD